MATRLAFWPVPFDEETERIAVMRSASQEGPYEQIAWIRAKDGYGNWVTHYTDTAAPSTVYYQAQYLKFADATETVDELTEVSVPTLGEAPYAVTPQMVLDNIQGIDMARVEAAAVQRIISWQVADMEYQIRQSLSEKVITGEEHGPEAFERIIGQKVGQGIQLRHFPVRSVEAVKYVVRGGVAPNEITMESLDIRIQHNDPTTGYNRGVLSIWPRIVSLPSIFAGARFVGGRYQNVIHVTFDYTHGWTTWPPGLVQAVAQATAAFVMEIAGEATTAGISSRSIDGYSESFTASATTTIFSARRIFYLKELEEAIKRYRKPIWA